MPEPWTKQLPTAAEINALPDPIRSWIHDLETTQLSDVFRQLASVREQRDALLVKVEEIRGQLRAQGDLVCRFCPPCPHFENPEEEEDEHVAGSFGDGGPCAWGHE